jgi:hypothetical protein
MRCAGCVERERVESPPNSPPHLGVVPKVSPDHSRANWPIGGRRCLWGPPMLAFGLGRGGRSRFPAPGVAVACLGKCDLGGPPAPAAAPSPRPEASENRSTSGVLRSGAAFGPVQRRPASRGGETRAGTKEVTVGQRSINGESRSTSASYMSDNAGRVALRNVALERTPGPELSLDPC